MFNKTLKLLRTARSSLLLRTTLLALVEALQLTLLFSAFNHRNEPGPSVQALIWPLLLSVILMAAGAFSREDHEKVSESLMMVGILFVMLSVFLSSLGSPAVLALLLVALAAYLASNIIAVKNALKQ